MRALRVHELGDPEAVLKLEEVEEPVAGEGEVLVEVEAASLNFFDILLCQGKYQVRPKLPFSPGGEVAGRVAGTDRRVVGTPSPTGGFAERVVLRESDLFDLPDALSAEKAAAMHITYGTAHVALHRRAALRAGETVLVHAGAGGVGSAAIQLARAAGARVFATAGGPEKAAVCRDLGAEEVFDYRKTDLKEIVSAVKELTDGRGADVVFDPVGGDVFDASRRAVGFEGRLLVVGFAGGRIAEAPTNHALVKNYSIVGVHWGLYRELAPELLHETHRELMRLYEAGEIDPLIHSVVPFEKVPEALAKLGSRATYGKLLTRPAG
ncbi:NADPH:quinone reductase and related Zn-dependent oxidoreductase [Rubrobacter radiotolerans]|uniref:NADPH:quinone oxidoreductase family protein n=1 Tax=Rubrobacter radiotolerans TaxID=42256 RepID=A0A023X245_RUBRA|nr:NADPH:quinone oxidoreductase family protein [Rubrobacter radiotolerans]AHY46119.1 NADPH:quinone reductase and related Zn-dependent oxidoreductase [Rubrobacter radiotolerans]MDX5893529.1 NADPH:quinone oxidoreductase family protein [Rubrobacter radiotolerans]SMC03926.1 Alcohol dehydrogenase GroES-like domain-containing protein [Rubrobacter radiotolerans DSM 5868]